MKISENFTLKEFECKCGCGTYAVNKYLLRFLQHYRNIIGKPIIITSGFRCIKHNKDVGGVKNSLHTLGLAIDFTIPFSSMYDIFNSIKEYSEANKMGIIYYKEKNFIHIDLRGKAAHLINEDS